LALNQAQSDLSSAPPRLGIALIVVLGTSLFWWVQPLGAERLVAVHGGGAEVWTACLCFFQLTLLVGYLYAHALGRWASPTVALGLHGVCALIATLTFQVPSGLPTAAAASGLTWTILIQLAIDLGPAAVVLAGTSPLLQLAYHRTTGQAPWRLYALANLAALVLLIIHPFGFEPHLSSGTQGALWRLLLGCYGGASLIVASRSARRDTRALAQRTASTALRGATWLWVGLGAAASGLLMATTEGLSRDMASSPVLWVAPLAVFLASIIFTFDRPGCYRRGPTLTLMGAAIVSLAAASAFAETTHFALHAGAYLAVLACGATLCHGELYRSRPDPAELTRYHLSMAFGGALGGIAVAIGAPLLFTRMVEVPVSIALVCVAVSFSLAREGAGKQLMRRGLVGLMLVALACAGLQAMALSSNETHDQRVVLRSRNAYGTLALIERQHAGERRLLLVDGNTTHGEAIIDGPGAGEPTLYYAEETGIGQLFKAMQGRAEPLRVGVIGMGVGTLAAYGRPQDTLIFYELNPAVVDIAHTHFRFLADSASKTSVHVGDGRALLSATSPEAPFDMLVVDGFSSDAIPTHLLTQEAMSLYHSRITNGGRIALHVTSRHLDLVPIIETLAEHADLGSEVVTTDGVATWVLVGNGLPRHATRKTQHPWTDDYAPFWRALR